VDAVLEASSDGLAGLSHDEHLAVSEPGFPLDHRDGPEAGDRFGGLVGKLVWAA
jgi:hypothetical protein